MPDLEFAHAVLVLDCEPVDDAPILDLRIRKGVRRHGVRLAVATARPVALDANAELGARFAPGGGEALLAALAAASAATGATSAARPPRRVDAAGARSPSCCAARARTS